MTEAQARDTLLSFESAIEGSHHGHPDFRVSNKIFATLWPGKGRSVLRLPVEFAEGLAEADPERHRVVSRSGKWGWLDVKLEKMDIREFSDLAVMAHAQLL